MKGLLPKALLAAGLLSAALAIPVSAVASPSDPTGVIKVVRPAHAKLNASQSSNWFGYDAGALERGTLFNSISADWTVPTVSQHAGGQAADSSTWIGIGGGCLTAGCTLTDATLIQTGTEQDVDASGHTSYSAWWELVPATGITISNFNVSPGDHIHASIAEVVPDSDVWTITLSDTTKGENFSTTVPYSSTHSTAEWIDETPVTIAPDGVGEASLPNLSQTEFTNAGVNGAPANLVSGEQIQLTDAAGNVIGSPSAPIAGSAFADCAWASSCPTPSTAGPISRASGKATTTHKKKHKRRKRKHHKRKKRHRRPR
ncbi:MAG TPA: G1 family glutamic endopeptidase [Solirubrobacteraceae bacterium]|nr:G1 family glutamic endopeptidase [Solirubrobacteraceae bacterium]